MAKLNTKQIDIDYEEKIRSNIFALHLLYT